MTLIEGYLTKEPSHPYGRRTRRYFVLDEEHGALSHFCDARAARTGDGRTLSLRGCAPVGFRLLTRADASAGNAGGADACSNGDVGLAGSVAVGMCGATM